MHQGKSGRASSDFPNPVSEVTPQKGPESYAIGVSDPRGDLFYTFGGGLQKMHGAFDTQLLEIRQWRLPQHGLHPASEGSLARTGGCRGIVERKPICEPAARPALEPLDERIGVGKMIGEDIGGL